MRTTTGFSVAILLTNVIAISIAFAQPPEGLSRPEAAALEDAVNNLLRESGVLQSAATVELRSPINSAILFIVPEGTQVKKGDRLVELDVSAIEDQVAARRIELAASEAELIVARSDLQNHEIALKGAVAIGEKQVAVANMKLDLFLGKDGEYQTTKQSLDSKQSNLEKAIAKSTATIDAWKARSGDSLSSAVKQVEVRLQAYRTELAEVQREQRLHERTKQVRVAELELELLEHKTNLTIRTNALESEIRRAQAALDSAERVVSINRSKLESLLATHDGAVMHAPHDGIVLYPERRRGAELLEEGSTVRERQTILAVADLSKLQVAVTVNETRIGRVQVGQRATMRFDALIDRGFQGTVTYVNPTPEPTTFLESSGRQYKVLVSVDEPSPELRVGMTGMVQIRTNQ